MREGDRFQSEKNPSISIRCEEDVCLGRGYSLLDEKGKCVCVCDEHHAGDRVRVYGF